MQEQDIEHLVSIIAEGHPKPILLLGAGASVKSGIPTTGPFVERAAAWVYAKRKQISFEDVRIRRSDWLPFLESQSWYNASKTPAENYPNVFKYLLSPREIRREFYRLILNPKVAPSIGYKALNELVSKKYFNTILTTNFDNILYKVFSADERIHQIDVIKSSSDYSKISTDPKSVQIIHLHGDVDNYTDKNDIDEIQYLNKDFIQKILPLLSDHPLIVVGYRGYENSIMKTLFLENTSFTTNYKHGIYWCVLETENFNDMPENLQLLDAAISNNLQFIKIRSFDSLFETDVLKGIKPDYKISYTKKDGNSENIFDLRAATIATISQLDLILLKHRMAQYCKTLHIQLKNNFTDQDLFEILKDRDILIEKENKLVPTNSGLLLFGKNPTEVFPTASIIIEITDTENYFRDNFLSENEEFQSKYVVEGNLWGQLNSIIEIVSTFNRPFKLKGETSTTVTPYPPLAIRELLTNCIVHRNYEDDKQTTIEITPKYIRIVNSGGLVEEVQDKLEGEHIEEVIKKGNKGIRGYRNPVLADLFYGTETMEKRGSGLADVFQEALRYSSQVRFGPDQNNINFEAIIFARPEVIDQVTNTAKQKTEFLQKFSTNISEMVSLPEYIYVADSTCSNVELIENIAFDIWPAYLHWNNKIIAFFDLEDVQYGFNEFIDKGTLEKFSLLEFCVDHDSERKLIELLNLSFFAHLRYLGLHVDKSKKRAFFERNAKNEENIQIRYQARVKSATRTIVKKRVSSSTGKIIYWEHKSFSFRIERFNKSIAILIIPNYTFTSDGFSKYVKAEKINILSTKRASRDYNIQYLNDLSFWMWVISKGGNQNQSLLSFPEEIMKIIPETQMIRINNEYLKASMISEEVFEDFLNESFEDFDVYDDVDKIALSSDEEQEVFDNNNENE
jgi:NAD-dependent SIR2 family protein deacetylase